MANVINAENVRLVRGVRALFDGVSLGVQEGERIGVLGLNGSGKTSLLRMLAGLDAPDSGRISSPRGSTVGLVSQTVELPPGATVHSAVLAAFGDAEHAWASDSAVRAVLDGLGLHGLGLDSLVAELSGGEQRRVVLAAALVADADLLLLDEPTNHLDIDAIAWLVEHLRRRRGAVVAVTHDRWFLDAFATRTWEVVDGDVLSREGGYSDWVFARAERLRLDRAAEERRRNLARKELAWLRRGPPARTSKPRYRIEAAEALIADEPEPRNSVQLHAFARRRLGRDVIELKAVTAAVPDGRTLLDQVDWIVGPGDRVGIVGANGSGKSTLLRLLIGSRAPDSGVVRIGSTVRLGYLSQEVAELPGQLRLIEAVSEVAGSVDLGGKTLTAGQLAERFGFTSAQQWTPVADLSGGERRRLQLLRILMGEPNVLILDEPTNDLDVDTLSALEDLLDSWPGTLLVVSHDRYLIERVADSVLALFGDGRLTHLPGGVAQYLDRKALAATSATSPAGPPPPPSAASAGASAGTSPGASTTRPAEPAVGAQRRVVEKELAAVDRKMARLQSEVSSQHEAFAAHDQSDYVGLAALTDKLRQLEREIADLETRWLELAETLDG
jgi:ATP-binding cassette subfamily F protein uup